MVASLLRRAMTFKGSKPAFSPFFPIAPFKNSAKAMEL